MDNSIKPYQFLNRDVIKYIAIFTMLCNHLIKFGFAIWPIASFSPYLCVFLEDIGNFTAITMIFFLVEGYYYTRSKKNYITRLLIFALISQVAWNFAFAEDGQLWTMGGRLNMIFTLCICFGIIYVLDTEKNVYVKTTLVLLGIYLSQYCDWAWLSPLYTIAFVWGRKSKKHQITAAFICWFIFMIFTSWDIQQATQGAIGESLSLALSNSYPMIAALICILFLYNGKQMKTGRAFSKWFFYIFYPAHLVILRILDLILASS